MVLLGDCGTQPCWSTSFCMHRATNESLLYCLWHVMVIMPDYMTNHYLPWSPCTVFVCGITLYWLAAACDSMMMLTEQYKHMMCAHEVAWFTPQGHKGYIEHEYNEEHHIPKLYCWLKVVIHWPCNSQSWRLSSSSPLRTMVRDKLIPPIHELTMSGK